MLVDMTVTLETAELDFIPPGVREYCDSLPSGFWSGPQREYAWRVAINHYRPSVYTRSSSPLSFGKSLEIGHELTRRINHANPTEAKP